MPGVTGWLLVGVVTALVPIQLKVQSVNVEAFQHHDIVKFSQAAPRLRLVDSTGLPTISYAYDHCRWRGVCRLDRPRCPAPRINVRREYDSVCVWAEVRLSGITADSALFLCDFVVPALT